MYDMNDLQRATGYSRDQLQDRLRLLAPLVGKGVHKGARGKVLVEDSVLAIVRRLREIEGEGLAPRVAVGQVVRELGNDHGNGNGSNGAGERTSGEVVALRAALEWSQREAQHWRELAERLQAQVEQLVPLALPRPRRWWAWWRR